MQTIHEHIAQYEKDLDAYYAHEKNKLTQIRKVLGARDQTEPIPRFTVGTAGVEDHKQTSKRARKAKVRDDNKTAAVIKLLRRPGGASMAEIALVTGWQDNSIRGFISGIISKKMRLSVQSTKLNNERRYLIAA